MSPNLETTPSLESETPANLKAKIAQLQTELEEKDRRITELEKLVRIDQLTGLPNRRASLDELERQIERTKRHPDQQKLCVAYCDLDEFKKVNDIHGHGQGDAVLKGFALRAIHTTREEDMLGRIGGEEFLLIFSVDKQITPDQVDKTLLNRYHDMLRDLNKTGDPNNFMPQTISIGCVIVDSEYLLANKSLSPENLMLAVTNLADELLYRSKNGGRNRSTVAEAKDVVLSGVIKA